MALRLTALQRCYSHYYEMPQCRLPYKFAQTRLKI